jgi:hypothetical protein
VVTLDEWEDHSLRVGVSSPEAPATIAVEDDVVTVEEANYPYPTQIPLTASFLVDGSVVQALGGEKLVYRPRDAVALAARSWNVWCSVKDVEPDERVYVLCRSGLRHKVEALMDAPRVAKGVSGVPSGWILLRPAALTAAAQMDEALAGLRQRRSLIPKLSGGLRVQRGSVYLHGGPPDVVFPDDDAPPRVELDGEAVSHAGAGVLKLVDFDLGVGRHTVTIDRAVRLSFNLVGPVRADGQEPRQHRRGDGAFTDGSRPPHASGLVIEPIGNRWLPLLPVTQEAIVIGDPPFTHLFRPEQPPWARAHGLPFHVFNPLERMAYPGGARPEFVARTSRLAAALLADGTWTVVALPGFQALDAAHADPDWAQRLRELLVAGSLRYDPAWPEHQDTWQELQSRFGC